MVALIGSMGGEMAPVAEVLSKQHPVVEPLRQANTINGQIDELATHLTEPSTLIGHSWGAMLALLFAAAHPSLVTKLILVSSGVFEERYAPQILQTRLERLDPGPLEEVERLIAHAEEENAIERIAQIFESADTYDALPHKPPAISSDPEVYRVVSGEIRTLRSSGELLSRLTGAIHCPVVAIHGDYDPHPAEGVEEPLARILHDFSFILLPRCGHKPWIERHSRDPFFALLDRHL